jgi:hypothetical protein
MPFTLAHPAAILPIPLLLGRFCVLAALIVGSVAPDLPYFVGDPLKRRTTHTLASAFWFSLPVGWLAFLVFEYTIRRSAIFLLPAPFRARLSATPRIPGIAAVSLSILLGALTHIAWDILTHEAEALESAAAELGLGATSFFGFPIWSYAVLQFGSTLLGLLVLVAAAALWFVRTVPRPLPAIPERDARARRGGRIALIGIPLISAPLIALALAPVGETQLISFIILAAHALVAGLSAAAIVLILAGIWLRRVGLGA